MNNRIKELRIKKGLTQSAFANKMNVAKSTMCNYENGVRELNYDTLCKYADYFNTTIDYLIGRSDIPNCTIDFENTTAGKNLVASFGRSGSFVIYEISDENAAIVDALLTQLGKKISK